MDARNNLTEGIIWKKLLRFFFPILAGMMFQQLYNTVDAVIVGKFVGAEALAAVGGSAAVITQLILGFFIGLSSGATVIIAQEIGAGNEEKVRDTLHTAVTFFLLIGVLVTLLGYFGTPAMLRLVKNPEDIMESSALYLRIYFLGSVPLLLYNLCSGILQAVGDSRHPLYYLAVSCVLNIVLDCLFVICLSMGIAGVGIASVLSMTVSAALCICNLTRTRGPHHLDLCKLKLHGRSLRRILRIGVPAGMQSAMYNISNIILQASVNTLGTLFVAAWTATGKLDGLYWMTSSAFGVAICAFVGQCYGAGMIDRMKKAVKTCMVIAQSVTVILSVLLLAIARPAYGLFLDNPTVIDYAVEVMWYFVPFYVIWTTIEILSGTLRGVGDTFRPMLINMIGTCGSRVAWMLLVIPLWHTPMSVSIVYPISWGITMAAFLAYYAKGGWSKTA